MKILLIDTASRSFSTHFSIAGIPILPFPAPNLDGEQDFDMDAFISVNFIRDVLKNEEQHDFDCLVVPVALTENYLEFIGLRLGCHLRFGDPDDRKSLIPIVFVGFESMVDIQRLSWLGNLLTTQGVYYCHVDRLSEVLDRLKYDKISGLEDKESFMEKMYVQPPANYRTHHSLANEWGVWRMVSLFDFDGVGYKRQLSEHRKEITDLLEKMQTLKRWSQLVHSLYFKYLRYKGISRDIGKRNKVEFFIPGIAGKTIVYIDDDKDKGWSDLLDGWFRVSGAELITFNDFVTSDSREKQLGKIKNFIEKRRTERGSYDDLYLVDLRLHELDFDPDGAYTEASGLRLLEYLTDQNKGAQVILFTASNKAWNINYALEKGAAGYMIKESPEMMFTKADSVRLLEDMISLIKKSLGKSFLKTIFSFVEHIKTLPSLKGGETDEQRNFHGKLVTKSGWLDRIFLQIKAGADAADEPGRQQFYLQAILIIINVLENFCSIDKNCVSSKTMSEININGKLFPLARSVEKPKGFYSTLEIKEGYYDFMVERKNTAFKHYVGWSNTELHYEGNDKKTLVTIVGVLQKKFNVPSDTLDLIIKFRYIRSNLIAHDTSEIDYTKVAVNEDDFMVLLNLINDLMSQW